MLQETSQSPELQLQADAKAVLALGDDGDAGRICAALRAFTAAAAAPGLAPGALASAAHLVLSRTILRHAPRLRRDPAAAPVMLEVTTVYRRFANVIREATPPALLPKVLQVSSTPPRTPLRMEQSSEPQRETHWEPAKVTCSREPQRVTACVGA